MSVSEHRKSKCGKSWSQQPLPLCLIIACATGQPQPEVGGMDLYQYVPEYTDPKAAQYVYDLYHGGWKLRGNHEDCASLGATAGCAGRVLRRCTRRAKANGYQTEARRGSRLREIHRRLFRVTAVRRLGSLRQQIFAGRHESPSAVLNSKENLRR